MSESHYKKVQQDIVCVVINNKSFDVAEFYSLESIIKKKVTF